MSGLTKANWLGDLAVLFRNENKNQSQKIVIPSSELMWIARTKVWRSKRQLLSLSRRPSPSSTLSWYTSLFPATPTQIPTSLKSWHYTDVFLRSCSRLCSSTSGTKWCCVQTLSTQDINTHFSAWVQGLDLVLGHGHRARILGWVLEKTVCSH